MASKLSFCSRYKNICLNCLNVGIYFKSYFSAVMRVILKNFCAVKDPKGFLIKDTNKNLFKYVRTFITEH